MRSHRPAICRLLLALALLAPAATAGEPSELPVHDFVGNPEFSSPRLSGDGTTLAVIHSQGDLQLILARGLADKQLVPLAKVDDPQTRLAWLEWANDRRLLISGQTRNPNSTGMRSRMTRLFGVDRDGANYRWLGKRWPLSGQKKWPIQFQDRVLHYTPDDPGGVLVEIRLPIERESKVVRMDVDSGKLRVVQGPAHEINDWYADPRGNVRVGIATVLGNTQVWARIEPGADLEKVIEVPLGREGPTFVGFHAEPHMLYVATNHEGREALREFDMRTRALGPLVFAHPEVDIDGVKVDPGQGRRVVGVRYTVDRPEIHFLDETAELEHRALRQALEAQLSTPVFHETVSVSADGAKQVLEVSSDVQPPVYYLYDRGKRQLNRIFVQRPTLGPHNLSPTRRVTYEARDGLTIPAYLTLPRGSDGTRLPTVALVHGGPWARDSIGWNAEVQLLASRGFAVFQMNFRGSTGFGREHLQSGYREWGQKIQDDITDGVRWLIAEGVADPKRIGITGASFGGYATLVGLVKTPELYRAGAAYAPVTDIEMLFEDDRSYSWDFDWHDLLVGGGRGDRERLRASSPLRRAAEIRAPVLLGHGENDSRLHVHQSRRMAKALRKANRDVEFIEFPHEVHGFLLEANRVRWYERLVAFFEEHLANPPRPAAPANN